MTDAVDTEPLIVNGRAVNPVLLESRPISRCRLEECQSYCCNGGVWIHTAQVDDILAHQHLILPHMPADRRDPSQWFDGLTEPDIDFPAAGDAMGTTVVPDPTHPAGQTCIFLNAERLCVLQKAGIEAGEHPWRFKPFYCALHPLGLDELKLELEEESEVYKEGGHCSRLSGDLIPLYQLYDIEAKLVLGEEGYAELDRLALARRIGV